MNDMNKNNQMPKWFSEQWKDFTGLEPTHKDFVNNTLFKPRNKFEEDPVSATVVLTFLGVLIVFGAIAVFTN
jgi:hypothetical protein